MEPPAERASTTEPGNALAGRGRFSFLGSGPCKVGFGTIPALRNLRVFDSCIGSDIFPQIVSGRWVRAPDFRRRHYQSFPLSEVCAASLHLQTCTSNRSTMNSGRA